ncbi:gamma-glutamyltransferase family protein [Pseudaestuariivita rosea]|uniref:gamma-glutamyltransferase family protein n=1 Tax=Pseudaestuariivita rosea TaxID=2763263 RepID=UPI001ABA6469|nr:gamma-glutamyltransferase family protein [Pseudaestuariivita rosea]
MRDFHLPGRSAVYSSNGMCATSHPLAAQVAIETLKSGGNAVDAAIAGAVLLGICEPQMTGIGGDCFVLLSPKDSDAIVALNGSGRSPKGLNAADLRAQGHKTIPPSSAHAVTVPGAVDAFCRLSQDWGQLDLARVLAPATHYAKVGVPVAPRVALDWQADGDALQDVARAKYLTNGQFPKAGQMFRAPGQAKVLEKIAKEGRDGFYQGEVAEDMVQSLNAVGGTHTLDDFANTECNYTDPISGTYGDLELVEHPPNGQGATAILLANILSQFDLSDMNPLGSQRAHIEAEAAKLAYDAQYRFIADQTERLDHMLSLDTAQKLSALIDRTKAMPSATSIAESVHKDTVYITVVDRDRMAVSLIYSIFKSFGSGLASEKFGILFQNRGAGFTLEEGHPNEAGGSKRPMHTIIPGMLKKNGRVMMPFGVMGGPYQPNGHARFLSNIVDFGMTPQSAIDAPRSFAHMNMLQVERGYSDQVRQELADLGHMVQVPDQPIGGAQAILIHEDGTLEGASDPRKDGCALGY